jgi:hypothetical protein
MSVEDTKSWVKRNHETLKIVYRGLVGDGMADVAKELARGNSGWAAIHRVLRAASCSISAARIEAVNLMGFLGQCAPTFMVHRLVHEATPVAALWRMAAVLHLRSTLRDANGGKNGLSGLQRRMADATKSFFIDLRRTPEAKDETGELLEWEWVFEEDAQSHAIEDMRLQRCVEELAERMLSSEAD